MIVLTGVGEIVNDRDQHYYGNYTVYQISEGSSRENRFGIFRVKGISTRDYEGLLQRKGKVEKYFLVKPGGSKYPISAKLLEDKCEPENRNVQFRFDFDPDCGII